MAERCARLCIYIHTWSYRYIYIYIYIYTYGLRREMAGHRRRKWVYVDELFNCVSYHYYDEVLHIYG